MWIKYLIITLTFFIFTILQTSLLQYFNIIGNVPNLIFILFFILIFFENETYSGFFFSAIAGFFLDITFNHYFGISIFSLLGVYFMQKVIFYFFENSRDKYVILNFVISFLIGFSLYNLLIFISSILLNFGFYLDWSLIAILIYNLVFGVLGFYFYVYFLKQDNYKNQLKLL